MTQHNASTREVEFLSGRVKTRPFMDTSKPDGMDSSLAPAQSWLSPDGFVRPPKTLAG